MHYILNYITLLQSHSILLVFQSLLLCMLYKINFIIELYMQKKKVTFMGYEVTYGFRYPLETGMALSRKRMTSP